MEAPAPSQGQAPSTAGFADRVPFWIRCLIHFARPAIPALIGALAPFVAAERAPSPLAWLLVIGTAFSVGLSGFCSYIDDSSDQGSQVGSSKSLAVQPP